ncbi:DUF2384 domain-containing protein [Acidithiobacillus ferrooxidans]|uniref:type II RES/Xre toxin-antitoxin system antitoxin n=1 Tax=Acidithiobacillus ferrooxidans TaxID=920 RepID=UPI001C067146|nr:antitoxin Xre-like helix-turn-helix domain-containing protein [Acidithiobacillus ferrooxidans]MBU2774246.1 DUF2384 domain-containing protein [Acidithiobacillus ferrooxidans]
MVEHVLLERSGILPGFPTNTLQLVQVIRSGIPASSVDSVCSVLHLSQSELASLLDIPLRTLSRRKREGALNSEESAKIIRLARVIERAGEVFESRDLAIDWLKSKNAALSGLTPLSLMDTDVGTESVLDMLGRIEHGVFA